MYILCSHVSICLKMGSLYSYCDINNKLVYPSELSRIAGFLTQLYWDLSGGGPHTPFQSQLY